MTFAAVFPGQGAQTVGMLTSFYSHYDVIKQTFTEASDVLSYDLWTLCEQGPADRLNATEYTQPALLAAGVGIWRVWQQRAGPMPTVMAGHSLGEYTALVCAGVLDFQAALRLVEFRGQVMQQAVPAGGGAMAAILGLDDEQVATACREASEGQVVAPANFNAPGQVVIAGEKSAIDRAMQLCKSRGAKRTMLLSVSVPSHCALMKPAAESLAIRLAEMAFAVPTVPIIHNVDVAIHSEASAMRAALKAQLYSPVRWVESIQSLAPRGVTGLVEFGPGRVLTGLSQRIDRSLGAYPAYDPEALDAALGGVNRG